MNLNFKKLISVFVIGLFTISCGLGAVNAGHNNYDYYYTIGQTTYAQHGGFGVWSENQNVKDSDIVGYQVPVYDGNMNFIGTCDIIKHNSNGNAAQAKNWHYVEYDVEMEPEVNETNTNNTVVENTTQEEQAENSYQYEDIEINSTQDDSEVANETQEEQVVNETQEEQIVTDNIIDEIVNTVEEEVATIFDEPTNDQDQATTNNATTTTTNNGNATNNTKVATSNNNNATTSNADNSTGAIDEDKGIPMACTGGVTSVIAITLVVLIIICVARVIRRN